MAEKEAEETLTRNQRMEIERKLYETMDLEEAKKYCKMLIPTLTEDQVQQMAEEIISIK